MGTTYYINIADGVGTEDGLLARPPYRIRALELVFTSDAGAVLPNCNYSHAYDQVQAIDGLRATKQIRVDVADTVCAGDQYLTARGRRSSGLLLSSRDFRVVRVSA